MKTTCVILATMGAASAFAPASSFSGAALTTTARAVQGPQMMFGMKKKAAPAAKEAAAEVKAVAGRPLKKAAGQAKQAVGQAKQAASSAKKTVEKAAPAAKTPLRRAAQQAPAAVKQAVREIAAPGNPSDFAIQFGSDVEAPFWDPAGLALDKPAETIEWYRAAELKHGRVAMLAALGTFVNAAGVALPDSVFQGTTKSFDALAKVADQRPGALIQIVLAIAAVEALSVQLPEGEYPGDLKFDPANQLEKYEAQGKAEELRLKELKNGRLAMIGIAGMWVQEALTGQGVFEQISSGHLSPVADGQGYF